MYSVKQESHFGFKSKLELGRSVPREEGDPFLAFLSNLPLVINQANTYHLLFNNVEGLHKHLDVMPYHPSFFLLLKVNDVYQPKHECSAALS